MRYQISTYLNFNEEKYLAANPDVVQGIVRKEFKSGLSHFEISGIFEQRFQKISLKNELPLAVVHIPKCAGTSLRIEIDRISSNMYNGTKYSIRRSSRQFFRTSILNSFESEIKAATWTSKELRASHDQYDCVMGHISLEDFHKADFRDFLVIVREPRIRFLSEWVFLRTHSEYDQLLSQFGVSDNKDYFKTYAQKKSNNTIAGLASAHLIFDSEKSGVNISCYWSNEIPRIMMEIFGQTALNIRSNESPPQKFDIDFRILDIVYELTDRDSSVLNRLMNSGLLTQRSKEQMDEEFALYLKKNFNYVQKLI
jgi:hypothetical protein